MLLTRWLLPLLAAYMLQSLMSHYGLREKANACPQTYALGLKEVWEVPEEVRGCVYMQAQSAVALFRNPVVTMGAFTRDCFRGLPRAMAAHVGLASS
jgi:hypothetical protein